MFYQHVVFDLLDSSVSWFSSQHVDGSFSVKPLKQKQIVSNTFLKMMINGIILYKRLNIGNHVKFCLLHDADDDEDEDVIAGCLQVDRVSYLLQEIYGIENKNNQETKVNIISMFSRDVQNIKSVVRLLLKSSMITIVSFKTQAVETCSQLHGHRRVKASL